MAPSNFLRLFTVFSLAILNISFDALPVNALAVERGHVARGVNHAHAGIAKKRSDSKQCKPRPVTSTPAYIPSSSPTTSHYSAADGHLASPAPISEPSTHKTTTTSSSPAPSVTPSTSGSYSGSKVALAWSNNEQSSLGNFLSPHTVLIYNWAVEQYVDIKLSKFPQLEFVPTIHGRNDISKIHLLTKGYAKRVKTFNEPEQPSQANMSPEEAHGLWTAHIEPLTQLGYDLIAPSVTTGSAGFDWLSKFMGLCKTCSISVVDVHYYGLNGQDFIDLVTKFHSTFGKPIWVSEYGCVDYSGPKKECTQSIFNDFFQKTRSFLEGASYVEMYALFGMFRPDELPNGVDKVNSMITCPDPGNLSTCKPNSLGYQYLNP